MRNFPIALALGCTVAVPIAALGALILAMFLSIGLLSSVNADQSAKTSMRAKSRDTQHASAATQSLAAGLGDLDGLAHALGEQTRALDELVAQFVVSDTAIAATPRHTHALR